MNKWILWHTSLGLTIHIRLYTIHNDMIMLKLPTLPVILEFTLYHVTTSKSNAPHADFITFTTSAPSNCAFIVYSCFFFFFKYHCFLPGRMWNPTASVPVKAGRITCHRLFWWNCIESLMSTGDCNSESCFNPLLLISLLLAEQSEGKCCSL